MSDSLIKNTWPDWEIEGVLGSGSFGTVYLARSQVDGAAVFSAVKEIKVPPAQEAVANAEKMGISRDLLNTYFGKFKNDFNWELTMFRTVKSPYLVPIEDMAVIDLPQPGWVGLIRTGIYTPLAVYFDKVVSTSDDAARLGREIGRALDACGEHGMVHGEIKPDNIMVTDAGAFILADFGVRRCLEKAGTSIFGELESTYDAPELGEDRKYTQLSDVYSLGKVIEFVAGGCGRGGQVDSGLRAVIDRATAQDITERYQSASELVDALEHLPLGRQQPRRAMAAAAAFDAVKRNGGHVRQTFQSGSTDGGQTAGAGAAAVQNAAAAKAAGGASAQEMRRAAGFDKDRWRESAPDKKSDIKRSRKFIIAGIIALVVVAAIVVLAVVRPWDSGNSSGEDTPSQEQDGSEVQDNQNNQDLQQPPDDQNPQQNNENNPDENGPTIDDGTVPDDTDQGQETGEDDGGKPDGADNGETQNTNGGSTSQGEESTGNTSGQNTSNQGNTGSQGSTGGQGNTGTTQPQEPEAPNNYYIFPSDTTLITYSDMEGMSSDETYMLINEIYARHGKIFRTSSIQDYFESQQWYTPVSTSSDAITPLFNATEQENIRTIVAYQKEMGYREDNSASTDPGEDQNQEEQPDAGDESGDGGSTGGTDTQPDRNPTNNYYLFPSSSTLITSEDLQGMTRSETYMLINEIYARHGKIFSSSSIQEYFESQQWYTPVTESSSEIEPLFNDIEAQNIKTIAAYQREMGYRD